MLAWDRSWVSICACDGCVYEMIKCMCIHNNNTPHRLDPTASLDNLRASVRAPKHKLVFIKTHKTAGESVCVW
jgi:hypothetical protein